MKRLLITFLYVVLVCAIHAENGYTLWLRYDKIDDPRLLLKYQHSISGIQFNPASPILETAKKELLNGSEGLLHKKFPDVNSIDNGAIICGTPESSSLIKSFFSSKEIVK